MVALLDVPDTEAGRVGHERLAARAPRMPCPSGAVGRPAGTGVRRAGAAGRGGRPQPLVEEVVDTSAAHLGGHDQRGLRVGEVGRPAPDLGELGPGARHDVGEDLEAWSTCSTAWDRDSSTVPSSYAD